MQLTTDATYKLEQIVQTAIAVGIKKLVIETQAGSEKIRGVDEKQTVVVITNQGVPDLSGLQLATNSLDKLSARLSMIKSQGDLKIEATEAANKLDISTLELSAGKTKVQFRATAADVVKAPKGVNDNDAWSLKFEAKLLPTLTQATATMGAEAITLASKDGKVVTFELVDTNKDIFTSELEAAPTWIGAGPAQSSFCQKYSAKTLLTLLKEATKGGVLVDIKMGENGILSLKVNGYDFLMLPEL